MADDSLDDLKAAPDESPPEESSSSLSSESESSESSVEATSTSDGPSKAYLRYYLVLIPRSGLIEMQTYETLAEFARDLDVWITRKDRNEFNGELLAFRGWLMDFTLPVRTYRLSNPKDGVYQTINISSGGKGKYIGLKPKKIP